MIVADLKRLTTPELLELMDCCEHDHMCHRVPNEVVEQLDATGVHILQAHSLHQVPDEDFVRARAMFKLLGSNEGSTIHFVDVQADRWDRLPHYDDEDETQS